MLHVQLVRLKCETFMLGGILFYFLSRGQHPHASSFFEPLNLVECNHALFLDVMRKLGSLDTQLRSRPGGILGNKKERGNYFKLHFGVLTTLGALVDERNAKCIKKMYRKLIYKHI